MKVTKAVAEKPNKKRVVHDVAQACARRWNGLPIQACNVVRFTEEIVAALDAWEQGPEVIVTVVMTVDEAQTVQKALAHVAPWKRDALALADTMREALTT